MISYGFPGVPVRLSIRRVRRATAVTLVATPIGWLMLLLAGDFHAPLGISGLVIYMAGLFAAFLVIPTGVQRIAAGLPKGLDEMQLTARLKAQSDAYRWFTLWILLMAIGMELVPSLTGSAIALAEPAVGVFFFWVIAWSIALPAFFLARALGAEPDLEEEV